MPENPFEIQRPHTAAETCSQCGASSVDVILSKCRMCHKLFCEPCAARRSGQAYCSQPCADLFFFGEAEDESDLVDE